MKIEQEIRFYFSNDEAQLLAEKLSRLYHYNYSYHEVTTMYDNPNPALTFYSKKIDGRLRLRYSNLVKSEDFDGEMSKSAPQSQCLITWKRRLPEHKHDTIRREEEIEYHTSADEFDAVRSIFEDVLGCRRVSSYERIRNFFSVDGVQITFDRFPYGIMLELELTGDGTDKDIRDELIRLDLNEKNASQLSCDDMYFELCRAAGIEPHDDILFNDSTMPMI